MILRNDLNFDSLRVKIWLNYWCIFLLLLTPGKQTFAVQPVGSEMLQKIWRDWITKKKIIYSAFVASEFVAVEGNAPTKCPDAHKYGHGPPSTCNIPTDPNDKPHSGIESWLTRDVFNDLFPKSNLGWGPSQCSPYNYDAFVIAARYFPNFGTQYVTKNPNGTVINQFIAELWFKPCYLCQRWFHCILPTKY